VFDSDDDEDSDAGDVHFAEILDENSAAGGKPEKKSDSDKKEDDEEIKLADDQFGLEEPFEPPEVETPHDYNWFIREMKNEIENKGKDKKKETPPPEPRKREKKSDSKSSEDQTGHFLVEEIASTKLYSEEPAEEKGFADTPDEFNQFSSGKKSGLVDDDEENKLLLVEKMLVKELSRQLAQKIIDQIPRKKLHQIIDELFAELKKY
jgi:hypothetical protein